MIIEELKNRLQDFLESEARSYSMEPGCATTEYVYRMWGGMSLSKKSREHYCLYFFNQV